MNKKQISMKIFTYTCISTIYLAIIYMLSMVVFADKFFMVTVNNIIETHNADIRMTILMLFVFISCVIILRKITSKMQSNYLKIILIVVLPFILVTQLREQIISLVVIVFTMAISFLIYQIMPKIKDKTLKKIQMVIYLIVAIIIFILISQFISSNINNLKEMNYIPQEEYLDKVQLNDTKNVVSGTYMLNLVESMDIYLSLIAILIAFMMFGTKEIVKDVIKKYNPSQEEIKSIIKGLKILFIFFVVTTVLFISIYDKNKTNDVLPSMQSLNEEIELVLKENTDQKIINEKLNEVFLKLEDIEKIDIKNTESKTLFALYTLDITQFMINFKTDVKNINNESLDLIPNYLGEIEKINVNVRNNNQIIQRTNNNLIIILFVLFILIEVYEFVIITKFFKDSQERMENDK